ncbi:MAG: anthranilate synthase component I, partial [Ahrensia sp.]
MSNDNTSDAALDNAAYFVTAGGVKVTRTRRRADYQTAIPSMMEALDTRLGAVLSSNYEYPGRYTRWDTAIVDPPLVLSARKRDMRIEAKNPRGEALLAIIAGALANVKEIDDMGVAPRLISLRVKSPDHVLSEEERSRAPSIFSVLRAIVDYFKSAEDDNIGFFGAFGYDIAFQFDPIVEKLERDAEQRDLVLFLPDEILVVDNHSASAWVDQYEFAVGDISTAGKQGGVVEDPFVPTDIVPPKGDHEPGEYAALVTKAKESFARGDLFEVVPGQMFHEQCKSKPSAIAKRLKQINPSPYSFFMNLGGNEFLIGASPEMFVRVAGRRIETCPISGTIKRGGDAIADSEQILKLLNSKKDESELTMCSDVDRNDKSRVCEPGSVRVIGRRQIEMYSRLIHTVDHIEGRLRDGMDAFDGFLSHAWAVTVTGAPKLWAMRFIENHEKSPRAWYGGAIGMV